MSKVVVITGASKGIGSSTAAAFAQAGYDVVINYKSDTKAAEATAKAVETAGQKSLLVQSDIFTEAGIRTLFDAVKEEFDHIDVLVNNAGLPKEPPFGEWTTSAITESFTANVTSAALCTQAAVSLIKTGGSIIFTTSIYGLNFGGNPTLLLYSAGKAAIVNLAQTLAEKLSPNIRCNVVAPGATKTPAWDGADPAYVAAAHDMTLQKEWVTAEDIASASVFLAEAPHITAQTIVVDAGWQKKIRAKTVAKR